MLVEHNPSKSVKEFLSVGDYSLVRGVFFVSGTSRGAIYDINTGRVFSVNKAACNVLTGTGEDDQEFWEKLVTTGIATKEKAGERSVLPELLQKPELQFVWFEILSDDCNESCIHCYADSMPPSHRMALGLSTRGYVAPDSLSKTRSKTRRKITVNEWKKLIEGTHNLGCRRCQFIGGEPFLYRSESGEDVLDLAQHAKNVGYEFVEIFTNATLLTEKKVERIKALGVNIAVSLYSKDPEVHDKITKTPGSHKKTVHALGLLKEAKVPTRIETVLMRPNEHTIQETQKFVEDAGFSHRQPDVLRPKGRGDNLSIMPSKDTVVRYGLMTSPNFRVDRETLSRHFSGHSCLLGKITITDNGDVLPCIFSRNLTVGNVAQTSLSEIIAGQKLKTIWRSTKDNVLVCQDCEYRYVCFDCRPLRGSKSRKRRISFSSLPALYL